TVSPSLTTEAGTTLLSIVGRPPALSMRRAPDTITPRSGPAAKWSFGAEKMLTTAFRSAEADTARLERGLHLHLHRPHARGGVHRGGGRAELPQRGRRSSSVQCG